MCQIIKDKHVFKKRTLFIGPFEIFQDVPDKRKKMLLEGHEMLANITQIYL